MPGHGGAPGWAPGQVALPTPPGLLPPILYSYWTGALREAAILISNKNFLGPKGKDDILFVDKKMKMLGLSHGVITPRGANPCRLL